MYEHYQVLHQNHPDLETATRIGHTGFVLEALKEYYIGEIIGQKIHERVAPVTSMLSFEDHLIQPEKSDIYCLLLDHFPVPDDVVPLSDIIEYRDETHHQANRLKLSAWVNKMEHSNYSLQEIDENIRYLLQEFGDAMQRAGVRKQTARLECAVKIIPETLENLLKINWSKLADPFFKLRVE